MVAGGSASRMGSFAELIAKEIGHTHTSKKELDISKTDRFAFYKIGPVLSISVSIGEEEEGRGRRKRGGEEEGRRKRGGGGGRGEGRGGRGEGKEEEGRGRRKRGGKGKGERRFVYPTSNNEKEEDILGLTCHYKPLPLAVALP